MGVFKEELYELEQLARKQSYVFLDEEGQPESADYGLFDTPEVRKQIQELISVLPDGRTINLTNFKNEVIGRQFKTAICWEIDGGCASYNVVSIKWYKAQGRHKAYFEIDGYHAHTPVSEYNKIIGK